MKKIFLLFAFAGLIIAGCSDPASVNSDPASGNQTTAKKEFIKLPVDKSLTAELTFTTNQIIDGDKGGKISVEKWYFFGYVNLEVKFPSGAFKGKQNISVTINTDEASVSFSPHLVFDKDVKMDLTYFGLDLPDLNVKNVDFMFLGDNGNSEKIESDGLTVSNVLRTMSVNDAKLKHFSRYGFVKDGDDGGI